jgi:hypothetical protein
MAGRKSTRRANAPEKPQIDSSALELAIQAQRRRMFQVSAIAACLGHSLEDVCAPGMLAPELQNVTDAMIQLLDDAVAGLDPTVLKLPMPEGRVEE